MHLKRFFLFLGIVAALASCKSGADDTPNVDDIEVEVKIEALSDSLFASRSEAEVRQFLGRHPFLSRVYFSDVDPSGAPPSDSVVAPLLFRSIQNEALRGFQQQVDSLFQNKDKILREPLTEAFKRIKSYYPDFQPPRVATIVTGFLGNDLYVSDSLIVIGLDYFGGPQARYRPNVYDYQLPRYQQAYLVPSILFIMSDQFVRIDPADKTLLADMVGYGKAFEFVKHSLPQTPDSLILGFKERDLSRIYNSQTQIWAFFVEGKLLYETNGQKKQKYIGERPFTTEIGPAVPGGIGRWLGWRIVSSYLAKNPDVTLPELMKNPNARQIFQESGYKGQEDSL